jgi:hypothetical protein
VGVSMIKFAVSSHEDYVSTTRPIQHDSMMTAGVPVDDVVYFVYSSKVTKYEPITDRYWLVPHNSIDFTALVSVVELGLDDPSYWFLMHDTTYVGPTFYQKLTSMDIHGDTIALSKKNHNPSGNMGLYRTEYLFANRDKVLEFKNPSREEADRHLFKRKLVEKEDHFFEGTRGALNKQKPEIKAPHDFYGTGMPRMVEYYQDIDFYKVKANWRGYVDRWNVTP